jgi:hypothetical protein
MLVNVLYLTFVGAFVAIVIVGHVLLLLAVWPGYYPDRQAAPVTPSDDARAMKSPPETPGLPQSKTPRIAA